MAEIKKLRGEDLKHMTWEDAKAWCEEQDREMFEAAKANGGYWCSARASIESYLRYVEFRLNEQDFASARRKGEFAAMLIGATLGTFIGAFLVQAIKTFTAG